MTAVVCTRDSYPRVAASFAQRPSVILQADTITQYDNVQIRLASLDAAFGNTVGQPQTFVHKDPKTDGFQYKAMLDAILSKDISSSAWQTMANLIRMTRIIFQ